MKNWEEIKGEIYIYLAEDLHTTRDDENEITIKQFQKCRVGYVEGNEIALIVSDGMYDGMDIYYYTHKDKPEDLLTVGEFKLINTAEARIRNELTRIAKSIELLNETPSDDLKYIYRVIKDRLYSL